MSFAQSRHTIVEAHDDASLEDILKQLNKFKGGLRMIIPYRLVLQLLDAPNIDEAYDIMGNGRSCYGVGKYIFCADKEVYPPETNFYIGDP